VTGPTQRVEPRSYVSIHEIRNDKRKGESPAELVPVWKLEKTSDMSTLSTIASQKHEVIDPRSTLQIVFDYPELCKDVNFYGSLSLMAYADGTPVEVAPYSMIGKEQQSFGVRSKSPLELSEYVIMLAIEGRRLRAAYDQIRLQIDKHNTRVATDSVELKKREKSRIDNAIANLNAGLAVMKSNPSAYNEYYYPLLEDVSYLAENYNNKYLTTIVKNNWDPLFNGERLEQELIRLKEEVEGVKSFNKLSSNYNNNKTLREYLRIVQAIHDYLGFIKKSGDNRTVSVFLSLSGTNRLDFDRAWKELETNFDNLNKGLKEVVKLDWDTLMNGKNDILLSNIIATAENLREFGYVKGPLLDLMHKNGKYDSDFMTKESKDDAINAIMLKRRGNRRFTPIDSLFQITEIAAEYNSNIYETIVSSSSSLYLNDTNRYAIRYELAKIAAKEIYKDLVYATIDLEKAGIKDARRLEIEVVWYNRDKDTTVADGTKLATARFRVRDTGWHLAFPESALLIKRINQDLLSDTYPLSPSNFKPTAGISMTWGYHNDKRGCGFGRFFKWLEPSFGINVSYLDFDTTKDFEVGAGPVIGLWDNKVFFTAGYNFMAGGQSPFYWGIGFSFSKTATWIKDAASK
jgi:hypothetical protein